MSTTATLRLFDRTWNPAASPSAPLGWRKSSRILVDDLFKDKRPWSELLTAFEVMRRCTWEGGGNCGEIVGGGHTFLLSTDDVAWMGEWLSMLWWDNERGLYIGDGGGTQFIKLAKGVIPTAIVHDQPSADERIPHLLRVPARLRAVWVRGMRGAVDPSKWLSCPMCGGTGTIDEEHDYCSEQLACMCQGEKPLHWVIASGGDDPCHPDAVRGLRDQCQAAGVPLWFDSWGEFVEWTGEQSPSPARRFPDMTPVVRVGRSRSGRTLDGREHLETPDLSRDGV